MIDVANKTYTLTKNAISSLCTNASQTFQSTPPLFPHMFFDQKDNPSTAEDLENHENAVKPMTEITIYTKGDSRLTDAKKIMAFVDTQMRSMGYIRLFGPQQITNLTDTTICRLLSRYSRVIADGDKF